MPFTISQISVFVPKIFKLSKYANWPNDLVTLNPILIKLIEVRYLSQIVSEMCDSLQIRFCKMYSTI